jgi:DNA-binding NarL/FixJ family response regulator
LDYPIRNEDGETTASGDLVVGDEGVDFVDDEPFYEQLTKTERQIVTYKRLGYNNAEIAKELGCTINNVTHHLRKLRYLWRFTCED